MALISELITVLKTQDAGFQAGIAKAQAQLGGMAKSAESTFKLMKTAIAAVGVYTLVSGLKDATNAVSELNDAAAKLGVSVEPLQRLRFAASQVGVSSDIVTQSLGRMTKLLGEAVTAGGAAAEPFTQLGLSLKDLQGLQADQQFIAISNAIKEIKDPLIQAKAGADIFGRGFIQNMGFIRSDIQGNIALFKTLGAELSGDQVKAVDALGDKYGELNAQWEGFKGQLLEALSGPLTDFAKWVQQSIVDAGGLKAMVDKVAYAFKSMGVIVSSVGTVISKAVKGWKLLIDATILSLGKLQELQAKSRLSDAKTFGSADEIKKASAEYATQVAYVKSLKAEIVKANSAKEELIGSSDIAAIPMGGWSKISVASPELKLQKDITQEYKTQLETIKQAVKAQQAKINAVAEERQLLDELVSGRGGENERFGELGSQAEKIKKALEELKNSGSTIPIDGSFGRGRSTLDTSAIEEGLRRFEEQRSSVTQDDLNNSRLNELQRAVSILNDPSQRFGAGGLERDTRVELKVLVSTQEGLEAKIAQSKANKQVILQTINDQFSEAAGGIQ